KHQSLPERVVLFLTQDEQPVRLIALLAGLVELGADERVLLLTLGEGLLQRVDLGGDGGDLRAGLLPLLLREPRLGLGLAGGGGLLLGLAVLELPQQDDAPQRAADHVEHVDAENRRHAIAGLHGMVPWLPSPPEGRGGEDSTPS